MFNLLIPKSSRLLQSILDKDISKIKNIIPTKQAYDNIINGKAPSISDLDSSTPHLRSKVTVEGAKNKSDKIFMEALFSINDNDILCHFLAVGAISKGVSFLFLKEAIEYRKEVIFKQILSDFTFEADELLNAIDTLVDNMSYRPSIFRVDYLFFLSLLKGVGQESLHPHKTQYTQITSKGLLRGGSPYNTEISIALLEKYPGRVENLKLMRDLNTLIPTLPLTFETIATIMPDKSIGYITQSDDGARGLLKTALPKITEGLSK